ncbi:MAG: histidinol-phosphate transaminase [Myxococcota bacterium]
MTVQTLKALFRPELESLSPYRVPAEPPAVKLDANENPFPLPGEAWETILKALHRTDLHRYPDGRAVELREALAARLGGDPDDFVLGAGSDELIALMATALSNPRAGQPQPTVLYPDPTFVMYDKTSIAHGWKTVSIALDDAWDLDVDAMSDALARNKPNLVYYARPNNPTGNAFRKDRIERLVAEHPDMLHVIDEAYSPFASDSLADWCLDYPQCALLGTLSKVGFAAIRVGWIRLHHELAVELDKVRQPFNLNSLSQTVATLALTELAPTLAAQAKSIATERTRLENAIAQRPGLQPFPSQANFLLVGVEGDATAVTSALLEREIAVRRFAKASPRLARCIRITVGTPEENDRVVKALGEIPCQ